MPRLSQAFYVIIDRGISAPVHGKEVVDIMNDIEKSFSLPISIKGATARCKEL